MATIEYANGKISDEEHVLLITCCRWPHHQEPTYLRSKHYYGREDEFEVGWDE